MARPKGQPKSGGKVKGSVNKQTKLAADILSSIEHTIDGDNVGYCPIAMQVKFIERAFAIFENCDPKDGMNYLRMAMQGNKELLCRVHGNIEIVKTDAGITAEEIVALMPQIQLVEGYKPIDDPESSLCNKNEDDI